MRLRKRKRCFPSCSSLHRVDEDEIYWRQRKEDEELEWTPNSTHLISQLTQCFSGICNIFLTSGTRHLRVKFAELDIYSCKLHVQTFGLVHEANAMVGSRSWIGALFHRMNAKQNDKFVDCSLSPVEEERLQRLQERLQVPYDETCPDHQESLRALWQCSFPNVSLNGLISDQWKDMGWQGPNPSTDFRGCGFISLENLLYFARKYPASFHRLLLKKDGRRATWEYPFAVAGINISFMLMQMLDLCSVVKPRCVPGMNFVKLLGENEEAFDILYCIAFEMMDAQWLAMQASYMDFNEVLHATRIQLERELSLEDINKIQELPAYNLLYQ